MEDARICAPGSGAPRNSEEAAREIFQTALRAVDPYQAVRAHAGTLFSELRNGSFGRLILVSFGKAAYPMARALTDEAGDLVAAGMVITKYGHLEAGGLPEAIATREAGHPVPDASGVAATREVVGLLAGSDPGTLTVCLISGGGSALFVAPYDPITLSEKQEVTRLLLRGGADINEMNAVRKHISSVKGGRLAGLAYPGRVVSLILSDVIGDPLDVIASGPTAPDSSTYGDAWDVLSKYGLTNEVPPAVAALLRRGMAGAVPETPKEGDVIFDRVDNIIVGNNRIATEAARKEAHNFGFDSRVISSEVTGEARLVARRLALLALNERDALSRAEGKRFCLISGGEPTVTVTGGGLGGRNMELALAFALEIEGKDGITFLSAGTDGTDGPTDAAGAVVDGATASTARAMGLDPERFLADNDAYNFFKQAGGLFITGPTGTNVMDLHISLIEAPPERG